MYNYIQVVCTSLFSVLLKAEERADLAVEVFSYDLLGALKRAVCLVLKRTVVEVLKRTGLPRTAFPVRYGRLNP